MYIKWYLEYTAKVVKDLYEKYPYFKKYFREEEFENENLRERKGNATTF